MKRLFSLILIMLLCLPLLTACQPTPEDDFVVNKGDDKVDDKVNATQPPASPEDTEAPLVPQFFPDRWDEEPGEAVSRVTVKGEAEVLTRADGLYPVYRTASRDFTLEDGIDVFTKLLGPDPVAFEGNERTKAYWEQELQDFLAWVEAKKQWLADGCPEGYHFDETPITDEEIRETTGILMKNFNEAPEENESWPVTDYSTLEMGKFVVAAMPSGEKAAIGVKRDYIAMSKDIGCNLIDDVHYETMVEDQEDVSFWHDVTLGRETAEAVLEDTLKLLGLDDQGFSIYTARKANSVISGNTSISYRENGWKFVLRRSYGYPFSEYLLSPSQWLKYTGDEMAAAPPINCEELTVFISEKGLRSFSYAFPREIMELANPNVELLSFDEVKQRVKNAFVMCFPYDAKGLKADGDFVINVYRMELLSKTLFIKDKHGYYETPCWMVFFDCDMYGYAGTPAEVLLEQMYYDRTRKDLYQKVLMINAVDGSIIHDNY